MVNTNRLKKIAFTIGGMTKWPSWPMITATTKVQAVVPIEKPKTLKRPRMVPIAIDSSKKISGAVATIHSMVAMLGFLRTAASSNQQLHWRLMFVHDEAVGDPADGDTAFNGVLTGGRSETARLAADIPAVHQHANATRRCHCCAHGGPADDRSPGGPTCHTGDADRSEWASDAGLRAFNG